MIVSILGKFHDASYLLKPDALTETLSRHLSLDTTAEWQVTPSLPWFHVQPKDSDIPSQGWKIHVSATEVNATEVLSRCLPILLGAKSTFKFIRTLRYLGLFNSAHAPRSASGKFITVYPPTIEQFREIANALHVATGGMGGPLILSDKPMAVGSLVHYRYGAFKQRLTYDENGKAVHVLQSNEGELQEDVRSVSMRQPVWAGDPFEAIATAVYPSPPQTPKSVQLHNRYTVTHAIRHANKGGVYIAQDEQTGSKVVIKEARPHVATDRFGRDMTDRLRQETNNLRLLQELGIAPRPIELFEDHSHLFLVLEWISGVTLREYVSRYKAGHKTRFPHRILLSLCQRVARLMARCHERGILIRDFSPNNIMITPRGRLYLIDVEMSCLEGRSDPLGLGEGTIAYSSPQQLNALYPSLADDYFSLGAVISFLTTLRDPVFPNEMARSLDQRIAAYIDLFSQENGVAESISEIIKANLKENSEERLSPFQVQSLLEGSYPRPKAGRKHNGTFHSSSKSHLATIEQSCSASMKFILSSLDFDAPKRPMPSTCFGEVTHPCNIQHGTAGIGIAMLSHARAMGIDHCEEALRALSRWTIHHSHAAPGVPPGLYFGLAGTAWFLLESSEVLHDNELKVASIALADTLPLEPPHSDITHGAAGIGLTLLHFFHKTGEPSFLERARVLGHYILSMFRTTSKSGDLLWKKSKTPAPDESDLFYGFAHGAAGIGYFLLCLYLSEKDQLFLQSSEDSAAMLAKAAVFEGNFLYWPHGPAVPTRWPHWCNGSSGVGTFLLRLALVTKNPTALQLARAASRAALRARWTSGCGQCHGLAGNGEFLVDLAQMTGDQSFLAGAFQLAEMLDLQKVCRPSGITFPDDSGFPGGLDFSTGSSGVANYFARLTANLPRVLMLDYLLDDYRTSINTTPAQRWHS